MNIEKIDFPLRELEGAKILDPSNKIYTISDFYCRITDFKILEVWVQIFNKYYETFNINWSDICKKNSGWKIICGRFDLE